MPAIELMNSSMLERMRASCQLAAACLTEVGEMIRPGLRTDEINSFVHDYLTRQGAYPSPLNYNGFPKSVCTSPNAVVCHGIPGPGKLRDGDIVNVDVTCYLPKKDGYHGDTSATFYVGGVSDEAKHVTEVARQSLELGMAEVRHGARIGDIGAAIQTFAEASGCSVVREYVGHGVGREFHMPPQVPHYGKAGKGKRLRAGMVFTIEPMINLGTHEVELQDDDWTVLTRDRKLSAQFEHTVLVTREGCECLTQRPRPLASSENFPWARLGPLSNQAAWAAQASPAVRAAAG